jgi:predicted anti-sigma-YlaC factor YlaD
MLVDDFLDGTVDPELETEARSHLSRCPECVELVSILKDDWTSVDATAPGHLTDAILERTSGNPCETALGRLTDFVDQDLIGVDRGLVSLHLDDCPDCRSVAGALDQLSADLPTLAENEPGRGFVTAVLSATSERSTLAADLVSFWRGLLRRPRFAFEAAYVGTVLMVALVSVLGARDLGETAVRVARAIPARTFSATDELVADTTGSTADFAGMLGNRVVIGARTAVASGRTLVNANTQALVDRAGGVSAWINESWADVAERLKKPKEAKKENQQ